MNRESYDAVAELWDAQRTTLSASEARILPMVSERLAPGALLLDLGCGSGQPIATHFAAAGYRIVGVDQSSTMLALAVRRLPTHRWVLSAIEDFPPVEDVDAVIAWDSLFHIPRERHAGILQRVRDVLPIGGRFALTAGGSEHPAFTDSMLGQRFFYDSHPPTAMVALLASSGFRLLHEEFLNRPDGGRDKGRIALVAEAQ